MISFSKDIVHCPYIDIYVTGGSLCPLLHASGGWHHPTHPYTAKDTLFLVVDVEGM